MLGLGRVAVVPGLAIYGADGMACMPRMRGKGGFRAESRSDWRWKTTDAWARDGREREREKGARARPADEARREEVRERALPCWAAWWSGAGLRRGSG